jgi:N utilization substance protein B
MDSRHQSRIKIIQNLFAYEFLKTKESLPYPEDQITSQIIENIEEIDRLIQKYAPRFPLEKIAKIDLVILRWAVFELTNLKKLPYKVVIDEAVELAKELAGPRSFAFINGVLGSLVNDLFEKKNHASTS